MDADELVARLFGLWDDVPATDEAAREAFLDLYEDPVLINGTVMPVDELVRRARALSAALHDRSTEVLSVVPSTDRLAVAFRTLMSGAGRSTVPRPWPARSSTSSTAASGCGP